MQQSSLFEADYQTNLVDIHRASEILGVSTATIRNWVKTGQILPDPQLKKGRRYFNKKQLDQLKTDIQSGRISRLNNRANKRNSTSTFIPIEQLRNKNLLPLLQLYLELINKHKLSTQTALLIHSLSVLKHANLIDYENPNSSLSDIKFRNKNVQKVILDWNKELTFPIRDFSKYACGLSDNTS